MRLIHLYCLVAACVILVGCGSGEKPRPKCYPVSGTLHYNGQVPTGAVVTLWLEDAPPDGKTPKPSGVIRTDGSFKVRTYDKEDGAPLGNYALTVVWESDGQSPAGRDSFAGRYTNRAMPVAKITVTEAGCVVPPLKLMGPPAKPPVSPESF